MTDQEKIARQLRNWAQAAEGQPQRYTSPDGLDVSLTWKAGEWYLLISRKDAMPSQNEVDTWRRAFHVPEHGSLQGALGVGKLRGHHLNWNQRSEAQGQLELAA